VIYGSLGLRRGISDVMWAFRKANRMEEFPAYLDDHPFQVMSRIKAEKKHRLPTADVVLMPDYAVQSLAKDRLLQRIRTHPSIDVPSNMRGTSQSVPVGATFMAMAYNTKMVSPDSLPEKIDDLAEEEWKGKLGTQSLTSSRSGNLGAWYFSFLRGQVGADRWKRFVGSLSGPTSPRSYDCIDHLMQGLVEEDVRLALSVYSLAYFREKSAGSPVALVPQERIPHMMTFTSAGVVFGSKKKESAVRFVDFLLSQTGQEIIGQIPGVAPVGEGFGTSYGFEHEITKDTHFHPTSRDLGAISEDVEAFRKLGLP
jgi:ABC-type Fe3+ transport system substrate-binding protein